MKFIPLTQNKFAQVDDKHFDELNQDKWHYSEGYARRNEYRFVKGKRKKIHLWLQPKHQCKSVVVVFALHDNPDYPILPAVEVQHTFYQSPQISTLKKWPKEAPPDFEFTLKAWQLITHTATS
jgi:hypothetical protein